MIYKVSFVLLIVTMFFMCVGCEIEDTCYDCDTIVMDPYTGELDCLIVDCVTNQNLN